MTANSGSLIVQQPYYSSLLKSVVELIGDVVVVVTVVGVVVVVTSLLSLKFIMKILFSKDDAKVT